MKKYKGFPVIIKDLYYAIGEGTSKGDTWSYFLTQIDKNSLTKKQINNAIKIVYE